MDCITSKVLAGPPEAGASPPLVDPPKAGVAPSASNWSLSRLGSMSRKKSGNNLLPVQKVLILIDKIRLYLFITIKTEN